MLKYNNVIEILRTRIPEFTVDDIFSDLPTAVFSLFSNFIKQAHQEKKKELLDKCIELTNDLAESTDSNVEALLNEIAIGLYDDSVELYDDYKSKISKNAAKKFDATISKWMNQ